MSGDDLKARWLLRIAALAAFAAGALIACGGPTGTTPDEGESDGSTDTPTDVIAPSDVAAKALDTSVRVTWTRDADDDAELVVYRALAQYGGDGAYRTEFQTLDVLPAGASTYEDADVIPRAGYVYGVAARLGEARSDIVEQQGPPVAVGGDPATGPAAITLFDVAPQNGSGAVTVHVQWQHEGPADGTECRIDFGDGSIDVVDDCAEVGEVQHTYAEDVSDALVMELTSIRGSYVDRAEHGVALGLNPDEDRYVALVAQGDDGLAVDGARRLGGNVYSLGIDRFGESELGSTSLDENGTAVLAEYSENGDRTPYTLFVMVNAAERYGTVLKRFDDVDTAGTLYLDAVASDLARWTIRPRHAGDRLGSAQLLMVDTGYAADVPPIHCCMLLGGDEHVAHVSPSRYELLVAGITGDGLAFFVHDEVRVNGDTTSEIDPLARPHGRLDLTYLLWDGRELDDAFMDLVATEASFWPTGGTRHPSPWDPEVFLQQTSVLLAPASYRGLAELEVDGWHATVQPVDVTLEDADIDHRTIGGRWNSALRIEGDARRGGTLRFVPAVTDEAGHPITQVFRSEPFRNIEPTIRLFDPSGSLAHEAVAPTHGNATYELPSDAPIGTYQADMTWDVGPFAEALLYSEATFEVTD